MVFWGRETLLSNDAGIRARQVVGAHAVAVNLAETLHRGRFNRNQLDLLLLLELCERPAVTSSH